MLMPYILPAVPMAT